MSAGQISERTGGCHCGAVRYRAEPVTEVLHCHCVNCRRLTGNFVAVVRTATDRLEFVDSDADSGLGWVRVEQTQFGVCRQCGSTLYFRSDDRLELTSIMVGTLDDTSGMYVTEAWFADEAQAHIVHPPEAALFDGNGAA
jgi:hypothetical protein